MSECTLQRICNEIRGLGEAVRHSGVVAYYRDGEYLAMTELSECLRGRKLAEYGHHIDTD